MSDKTGDKAGANNYVHRKINVTFSLGTQTFSTGGIQDGGQQTFAGTGGTTSKVSGLRVRVQATNAGTVMGQFNAAIYGMTESMMNQLSTLGQMIIANEVQNNSVTIEAGDDKNGMTVVAKGTIRGAWQNFEMQPQVFFHVEGQNGYFPALKPVPAIGFSGPVKVAEFIAQKAKEAGLGFENAGVNAVLASPYFWGTAIMQAQAAALAAGVRLFIDRDVMVVQDVNTARESGTPLVAPETGLIGYPSWTPIGIRLRTVYNPSIVFGGQIQVKSSLSRASGTWIVNVLSHYLESEVPGGDWMSVIEAYNPTRFPGGPPIPGQGE